MKIICIGDSLTTGYGVFRRERWTDILINEYGYDIENKGINGDTSAGMLERFYEDAVAASPTHVLIMGGCNDLMSGRKLKNIESNIEKMVYESIENHIVPILSVEIPVIPDIARKKWSFDADYDYVVKNDILYREWMLNFSKEKCISCIDLCGIFEEELKCMDAKNLYVDGLHPTNLGHGLIAKALAGFLKSL
ncbi:MAG: GDSL-type esterase/lipase family protein [Clostridiaceae bacterium]